jgi:hypothetical protein
VAVIVEICSGRKTMFGEHGGKGSRRRLLLMVTGLAVAMLVAIGQSIATAPMATASIAMASQHGSVRHGVTFYVATNGNDRNQGTSSRRPIATLARAQQLVRAALRRNPGPITVDVAGGTYYLRSTLNFTNADSGTSRSPVTWQAEPGANVTVSGGTLLAPHTWTPDPSQSGVLETTVQRGLNFDQLFVNGTRQTLARYPNADPSQPGLQGTATLAQVNALAANWSDFTMGDVRAMHCDDWGQFSYKITGYTGGQLGLKYVGDSNRATDCPQMAPGEPTPAGVVVEGLPQLVTAPGDWWYNPASGQLLYYPTTGLNLSSATFQTADLDQLITINGKSASDPVRDIAFKGFNFTGTHRALFNSVYVPDAKGDWSIDHKGAIYMSNSQRVTVTGSKFDQLGGNGVFIYGYADADTISNNTFTDDGETDVQVVGSSSAVRDYADNYYDDVPINDTGKGPKNNYYPRNIDISGNVMTNMGQFALQSAGINISMSEDVTVNHNTISGSPRACLNIEDGTWGGDNIENNVLYDCVTGTGDNGAINVWGRDRWWAASGNNELAAGTTFDGDTGEPLTDAQAKQMMLLDTIKPIVIQHNLIDQTGPSWSVDFDDGSSNFVVKDNVILGGGVKLRDGFDRTVVNNVIAGPTGLFEQVSKDDNGDVIQHNIVLGPTAYSNVDNDPVTAEYAADDNLFWDNGAPISDSPDGSFTEQLSTDGVTLNTQSTWVEDGFDVHSKVGNPDFESSDPGTTFNFTVASGSPALAVGFKNFPMTGFGASNGSEPPAYSIPYGSPGGELGTSLQTQPEDLMGATATNVSSEAVESLLGISNDDGLYLVSVPSGSYAATVGLQSGDDIMAINGNQVTDNRNTFWIPYNSLAAGAPITLTVRRQETDVTLTFDKTTAPEELNDTSGVVYNSTGNGPASTGWIWRNSSTGGGGSYLSDIWATQNIGDSWSLTFNGTGITITSETAPNEGNVDLTIDGQPYSANPVSFDTPTVSYQSNVISISGLAPGVHTITGMMMSGSYMIVDAFETHPSPSS